MQKGASHLYGITPTKKSRSASSRITGFPTVTSSFDVESTPGFLQCIYDELEHISHLPYFKEGDTKTQEPPKYPNLQSAYKNSYRGTMKPVDRVSRTYSQRAPFGTYAQVFKLNSTQRSDYITQEEVKQKSNIDLEKNQEKYKQMRKSILFDPWMADVFRSSEPSPTVNTPNTTTTISQHSTPRVAKLPPLPFVSLPELTTTSSSRRTINRMPATARLPSHSCTQNGILLVNHKP